MQFSYKGGEKTAFVFNIGAEGSFASNAWYPLLEKDGRGTGKLSFIVPRGYKVLAPGQLNIRSKGNYAEYYFDLHHPSDFTFTIGKYIVKKFVISGMTAKAYLPNVRK